MKHYVLHLVSVVLLIGMLLAVLQLVRSNQIADLRIAELKNNAPGQAAGQDNAAETQAAEQERIEKERAEKERVEQALAEKERLEKERAESAEKIERLETENKGLKDNLAMIEKTVEEMDRGFQVVSAHDAETLGLTFEQTPRSGADAEAAVTLADTLKDPTPAAFKEAAEKTLEPLLASSRELVLDPETGCVIDPVAAIVETAAKAAGLSASTTIFWDLQRKAIRSEVAVSDPAKKAKDAVVAVNSVNSGSAGGRKSFSDAALQKSRTTTVFPFTGLSLFSSARIDLLSRASSVPVGGLYVHYIGVYSKAPWTLEYVFPEDIEPESVNMNVLSLTPGVAIDSSVSGRTLTFRIDVKDAEADFLVIADKPFFPESASIRLK